jgi:DNA-binding CsgD family transcriptional regulator/RecA/RadA recombinase
VIVGRAAELATVEALVGGVGAGRGGVLLVVGEAGIGKSTLLREAAARARRAGLTVLGGRASEGSGAYRAVAEALAGLAPDGVAELRPYRAALGRILPGWAGDGPELAVDPTVVLGEGVLRLLRTLGGVVLVLEDVHWADADTWALIDYLAGAVRVWPVLLAVSARDDEPTSGAVDRLRASPEVTTVPLRRLTAEEVERLATSHAGGRTLTRAQRRLVAERSDGLPLLVEELVAGLVDKVLVPPSFFGLIDGRLARLREDHRRVLRAAAVLGPDPDWSIPGEMTGLPEATVLDAVRAAHPHLLAGATSGWRHALVRDAVLATVPGPERAALARRAANVLLDRGGDDGRAAELLAVAGDDDRAVTVLLRLAGRDVARGALHSAEDLLARATAMGVHRVAVAAERVRVLTVAGRAAQAIDAGVAVLDDAVGEEHAELCLRLAQAAVIAARWADADHYVERAGRPDDPRSLCLAADAAFGSGRLAAAARLAAEATARAEALERWDSLVHALTVGARCAMRHDPPAAVAGFRRAAQLAAEHGLHPLRVTALIGLATVLAYEEPLPASLAQARELALDTGQLAQVVAVDVMLVDLAATTDGPRAAEPLARDVAARAGALRLTGLQAIAELFVALGRATDGDPAGMTLVLDAATARPDASIEVNALAPAVQGLERLFRHDLIGANALLDTGMELLGGHDTAAPVHTWGLWALLRTVLEDRGEEARSILRSLPAVQRVINLGGLRYAEAVAAGRTGEAGRAAELLAEGDAILAEHPWWGRLLRLFTLEAAIADGWGAPVPVLRADLEVFERTGEPRLARICHDLLRRAGAPTRRGRGTSQVPVELRALGVTSREMDVLTLIVDGLTNREIADRLFLSPRTVETHVANLLAKAGVRNRADLRRLTR